MTDNELVATLAAAQRAPADDYMVWARVESRGENIEIPLETMRLPVTLELDVVRERVEQRARNTLSGIGFDDDAIASARYFADPLPTAADLTALLDAEIRNGAEMTLVDFVHWEALRLRLHLLPTRAEFGNDEEMRYKDLRIQRSAAS